MTQSNPKESGNARNASSCWLVFSGCLVTHTLSIRLQTETLVPVACQAQSKHFHNINTLQLTTTLELSEESSSGYHFCIFNKLFDSDCQYSLVQSLFNRVIARVIRRFSFAVGLICFVSADSVSAMFVGLMLAQHARLSQFPHRVHLFPLCLSLSLTFLPLGCVVIHPFLDGNHSENHFADVIWSYSGVTCFMQFYYSKRDRWGLDQYANSWTFFC